MVRSIGSIHTREKSLGEKRGLADHVITTSWISEWARSTRTSKEDGQDKLSLCAGGNSRILGRCLVLLLLLQQQFCSRFEGGLAAATVAAMYNTTSFLFSILWCPTSTCMLVEHHVQAVWEVIFKQMAERYHYYGPCTGQYAPCNVHLE